MWLIDADEALRSLPDDLPYKSSVRRVLIQAPTVDAVAVVRCKDCTYHGWEQEPCHGKTEHFCELYNGLVGVTRDTFCSYGRPKEAHHAEPED